MSEPATAAGRMLDMDILWSELLLDACASDGPIRDADVRQAINRYRPRIEAEARAAALDKAYQAVYGIDELATRSKALAAIDALRERSGE